MTMNHAPEDTVILNLHVVPDRHVGEIARAISEDLPRENQLFYLDKGKFPHMTVYMARFPKANIPAVAAKIRELLASHQPISFVQDIENKDGGFFATGGNYVEVSYKLTNDVRTLQQEIAKAVAELCWHKQANQEPIEESYYAPYTDEQKRNVRETGYDLFGQLFRPHITLSRYEDAASIPPLDNLHLGEPLNFDCTEMALYIADENGAVFEEVERFTLGA